MNDDFEIDELSLEDWVREFPDQAANTIRKQSYLLDEVMGVNREIQRLCRWVEFQVEDD
jgi:hypothetical protein